jgi:hypothetical protein
MVTVRVSSAISCTSKVDITCTEVTSSYEEIGNSDDDDDSNNYSIQLLFSKDRVRQPYVPSEKQYKLQIFYK